MSTHNPDDPFDLPPATATGGSGFEDDESFTDPYADRGNEGDQEFDQGDTFPDDGGSFEGFDQEPQATDDYQPAPQAVQPAQQPKSFMKSPFGIAICGIAALGVVAVGITAVKVSGIGDSGSEVAEVEDSEAANKPVPAAEVDFGAGANAERVVSAEAKEVVQPPVAEKPSVEDILGKGVAVAPVSVEAPDQAKTEPVSAQAIAAVSAHEAELQKALDEQKQLTAELKKSHASLSQQLSKLSEVVEKSREKQIVLANQVSDVQEKLKPAAQPVVAEVAPATTATSGNSDPAAVSPLAKGRTRVPGLQIVDATPNGDMSIVKKVANGRVFTMFKGERIGTPKGSFKITGVLEDGALLLVGDKYFIDKQVDEVYAPAKAQPEAKVEVKAEAKKPAVKKEVAAPKEKLISKERLRKYTCNAVFEKGQAFGVVTDSGDFKIHRLGESVPGIGKVYGLDDGGNLKIGDSVIECVY